MRLFIGIRKPGKSIIGLVFSGEIDSIGKNIKRFKTGDSVYGLTGFRLGTYAEYKCLKGGYICMQTALAVLRNPLKPVAR
jgi:NADPH:quinone reductase-like Zn-dependent oxidoreductase